MFVSLFLDLLILKNSLFDDRSSKARYLSNSDEIDAFGTSIAYGMWLRFGKDALCDFDNLKRDLSDVERLYQRYALATLYYATDGERWYDQYQFLSNVHEFRNLFA